MNYLFQSRGLLDNLNQPHADFSGAVNPSLNETSMTPTSLGTLPYRTAWYEPLVPGTTAYIQGYPAAKRFCSGRPFPDGLHPPTGIDVARVDAATVSSAIAWNSNSPDINLDGALSSTLVGFNDWDHVA
jgi:hypothetical protein